MIPVFTAAGHRVVAPDLFGFGRSDKPVDDAVYTFNFHRGMLMRLIEALDLERVTLVVQDWGGLLGLTLPMEYPDRIDRLIVMNTGHRRRPFARTRLRRLEGIRRGEAGLRDRGHDDAIGAGNHGRRGSRLRRAVSRTVATAPAYAGSPRSCRSRPTWRAWMYRCKSAQFFREQWNGSTFMAIGMQDPVLGPPVMQALAKTIRGCPVPFELPEAGHFVQEHGQVVAERALAAFGDTSATAV